MSSNFVTYLESAIDGTRFEPGRLYSTHKDRPLWVRYDLAAIARSVDRDELSRRGPDLWRWRELLPVQSESSIVSLGERTTPLLKCPRLGVDLGLPNLWIKDDSQLPTGSFKSRGQAVAISMANELGVRKVAIPTAGNAGGAMAAYAARAGMEAYVFMPSDTPRINQFEASMAGANVFLVDGLITDCGKIVRAGKDAMNWFDLSTLREPYRIEGKKTMGLELAEQFGWRLPDVILYPTGGGTGLIGMWKAFQELKELGWLDSDALPRMVAVQSDGCAPIVRAFENGSRFAEPFSPAATIASGIRVPAAIGDFMIIDAIRESLGTAVAVDETRIVDWMKLGMSSEGISICPESATCIGASIQLREQGWLTPDERVVIYNCGAAQKYVDVSPLNLPRITSCDFNDWSFIARTARPVVTNFLLAILLTMSVLCRTAIVSAQQPVKDTDATKLEAFAPTIPKRPTTDSFGDSLPAGARLRFGTVRFHPPAGVSDLALSPDEKTLVTVGAQIIVWDPETGRELWRAEGDQFGRESRGSRYGARPLVFSSDSSHFFTTRGPTQIAIWDVASKSAEYLTIKTAAGDAEKQRDKTLSLDVTPDGKTIALGRADGIVVCHRDGKVRYEIANTVDAPFDRNDEDRLGFFGHYSGLRFSPDGANLAVVTSDQPRVIRIHDTETGREQQKISLTSKLVRLAFSPDGKQIAATERDSSLRLYEVDSGKQIWSHTVPLNNPYENYLSAVAYSPDGKSIVVGATDHLLHIVDSSKGEEIGRLEGTHSNPWTLAFTANGKVLYSSGWDGTIRRWEMAKQKQLALPQGFHATEVIAASPDGRTLAYQDDARSIHLVTSDSGQELKQFELPGLHFSQLQFSPDGQLLAGGGSSGDQVHVAVWTVKTGEQFRFWTWPKGRDPHSHVEALCFTPDCRRLAAAVFRQSAAYIWDLASDQQIATLKHQQIYGLSFSSDSKTLATAGWDSVVRFSETDTGRLIREFRVSTAKDDNGPRFAIARQPGGKVNLNQRIGDLRMYAVCYAPNSDLIATAHMNGEVWAWEASSMQPMMMISIGAGFVYGALSFSPDGLWLATGAVSGDVKLWDPLTGQNVWDQGKHQHYVYTVGFGQDSRTLVSGSDDGVCYQWDLRPAEIHSHHDDLPKLWDDISGEESATVYQAMWALSDSQDRAVDFIAEKLRSVERLIDTNRMAEGVSAEEHQRRMRMLKRLAVKDPKVELTIAACRAVSLLGQIGTPAARQLLVDLAKRDPRDDLGTLATNVLNRYRIPE